MGSIFDNLNRPLADLSGDAMTKAENDIRRVLASIGQTYDWNRVPTDDSWDDLHEGRRKANRITSKILDKCTAENRAPSKEETMAMELLADCNFMLSKEIDSRVMNGRKDPVDIFGGAPSPDAGNSSQFDSGWRDAAGRVVPVLAKDQSFAAAVRNMRLPGVRDSGSAPAIGLGTLLRAKAIGPRNDLEVRALSEGVDSAGGFSVPIPVLTPFIDLLRSKMRVVQAGAVTVPMTEQKLNIVRVATDPTVTWRAENVEVTASDPTLERVQFTAQSLGCLIKISRELLSDSLNIDEILSTMFAESFGHELDRVCLVGSGSGSEPTGIINQANILTVNANAGLTNYDFLLDGLQEMLEADAPAPTAAIMSPRTLIELEKLKATDNQPLERPTALRGLPFYDTTAIPNTYGGSPDNESRIIMAHYPHLMIGMRCELMVSVLSQRYAEFGQVGFFGWMRADVQLAHPESFVDIHRIGP